MTAILLKKRSEFEIFGNINFENLDSNKAFGYPELKKQKTDSNSFLTVNDDTISGSLSKSEKLSCASSSTNSGG